MSNLLTPTDGMTITENTTLTPGVYHLPKGIVIGADNVTLDGGGATIIGSNREGRGVSIEGRSGVTVKNLNIREYYHGIYAHGASGLTLTSNQVTGTAEIEPNTIFLEIWLTPDKSYGGGIFLWEVTDSVVEENDIQHQMNGLLTYFCSKLTVRKNQANYNSGYGIHLYATCDSLFEANSADYCCRFEPREGGRFYGHMGADATGFLIIYKSCRNVFRYNQARLGGDGFFMAGLAPDGTPADCADNLYEENDGSLSPNIAFEGTFCSGTIYRNNRADRCNYGFWLGFSWNTTIERNQMVMNRQAGIAVEGGHHYEVRDNNFQANGHGILLWGHYDPKIAEKYGATCHHWTIEGNTFTRNGKAIKMAADQDHGIRNLSDEKSGNPESRPHSNEMRKNDIQDNRIGVDLYKADNNVVEGNILNRNVEANVRQDDCEGNTVRNNLGSAGAYL